MSLKQCVENEVETGGVELSIDKLVYGLLEIDTKKQRVHLKGEKIKLTPMEYELLVELVDNTGMVQSREALKEKLLPYSQSDLRTLDVHLHALRKKLGPIGSRIQTVRGTGYRLIEASF